MTKNTPPPPAVESRLFLVSILKNVKSCQMETGEFGRYSDQNIFFKVNSILTNFELFDIMRNVSLKKISCTKY